MKIDELKEQQQKRLSALFHKYGVFFAFSKTQFEESRKPGVEYVSGPAGMLIPKEKKTDFINAFKDHVKRCETEFKENIPMERCIAYELASHEAYYTRDLKSTLAAVQCYFPECTYDDVYDVFQKPSVNSDL